MIEAGQAVYFIENRGMDPVIKFGIVRGLWEERGFYHYAVDFLSIKEHRYIKGIPFDEFTNTEWRKIPKELRDKAYTIQPDVVWRLKPEERALLQTSFIDNPRDIERLYKAGLLVSKEKISTAHIEVELNRSNEYRIVKIQRGWTYDYGKDKRIGVILEACKLYEAYSKAKEEKERIEAKYKAERALSDYEWSVREIDKVLRLLHDDTLAKEYRRILLSMANVDDIEIKKIGNIIYYRYFSKKEPYKMVQL